MKNDVVRALQFLKIGKKELKSLVEVPKDPKMGDYALPCFTLAKKLKKNPADIAKDISSKVKLGSVFENVESVGPYVNFFISRGKLAEETIKAINKGSDEYGSSKVGRGKKIVVEMSSPNIAKPFGIGQLRSTIIGNSISNICEFQGYKTIKINYLGDWGTQFGKIIVGYKKIGKANELKKDPIKHMLKLYTEGNKEKYEDEAREWFKKLESNNLEVKKLWNNFRELSLKYFREIYKKLGIKFDVFSGESQHSNKMMELVVNKLKNKKLIKKDQGAEIVDLEKYGLGISLIKKSDGATLYITRDLAAAIHRKNKYKFDKMIYEVGSEQNLHFRQLFKILELMGYKWAKDCVHVNHGLYLGKDGKRFRTRKGKTVFMEDILDETIELAKKEIKKRHNLSGKEIDERARKIAIAAIFYGDLKNYRGNDVVFDIERFLSFEGDTGPYLLYSYARAKSILKKAKYNKQKKFVIGNMSESEKRLVSLISDFPEVVKHSYENLTPSNIANYSYELAKVFNEFYHDSKVIGSDSEQFKLKLVDAFSQTIKNSLVLLGIEVIEEM